VLRVTNYSPAPTLWAVSYLGRKSFLLGYFSGSDKQFPTSAHIQALPWPYSTMLPAISPQRQRYCRQTSDTGFSPQGEQEKKNKIRTRNGLNAALNCSHS